MSNESKGSFQSVQSVQIFAKVSLSSVVQELQFVSRDRRRQFNSVVYRTYSILSFVRKVVWFQHNCFAVSNLSFRGGEL